MTQPGRFLELDDATFAMSTRRCWLASASTSILVEAQAEANEAARAARAAGARLAEAGVSEADLRAELEGCSRPATSRS